MTWEVKSFKKPRPPPKKIKIIKKKFTNIYRKAHGRVIGSWLCLGRIVSSTFGYALKGIFSVTHTSYM